MGEQTKPRRDKGTGGLYKKTARDWNAKLGEYVEREYWQAVQELTKDDGTRKRITGSGATRQIAQRNLQANIAKHFEIAAAGTKPKKSKKNAVTLAEWLDTWHASLSSESVSETVKRKYKRNYELHIVEHIGHIPLTELNRAILEEHFSTTLANKRNERTGKELLGSSARRNIYKTLNTALKTAVADGLIDRNPLTRVTAPPMKRPADNVPQTAHKAQALLLRMKNDNHPDYARFLLMFLGLRRSERLGLSWSNIRNLGSKDAKIVINQQLARYEERGRGYYIKDKTKTGKERTIPIPEPFLSTLREHKRKMDKWKQSPNWNPEPEFADLVFLNEDGSIIKHNQDNLDWHKVLDHYRFTYWRAHLNRHITATLLADQQPPVSIGVVQELLGNGEAMTYYYARITSKAMKVPLDTYGETAFGELLKP